MSRLGIAFRCFFRVLRDARFAEQVGGLLQSGELLATSSAPAEKPKPAESSQSKSSQSKSSQSKSSQPQAPPAKRGRSDALSLLAALQREGRLVDFLEEPIAAYSDAQIGAAVRDVHRQCHGVLERMFGLRPAVDVAEGAAVSVPAGPEAARYKLVGNVAGEPPFAGKLCHHGWEATRCELPEWTGGGPAAMIVAPAEVELG